MIAPEEACHLVKIAGPLPARLTIQTNIPRNVKVRLFVRESATGRLINEVSSSSGHEAQPFEGYRSYEPLPFLMIPLTATQELQSGDKELVIAFLPVTDKEWSLNLMNFPAYERSPLSYQYEPIFR